MSPCFAAMAAGAVGRALLTTGSLARRDVVASLRAQVAEELAKAGESLGKADYVVAGDSQQKGASSLMDNSGGRWLVGFIVLLLSATGIHALSADESSPRVAGRNSSKKREVQ